MNRTFFKTIAIAALSVGILSTSTGCALLDNSKKHVVTGSGEELTQNDKKRQPLAPPKNQNAKDTSEKKQQKSKPIKNKKNNANEKVTSAEVAEARKEAAALDSGNKTTMTQTDKTNKDAGAVLPADFSLNGEWTIYSVRNNMVTGEERPYITFDLAAKRFYGSNGCNIVNGDITLSDKDGLKLDNIIATMKMCSDAPFEYLINLALSEVSSYSARQVGPNTFLDLKGNGGSVIMVLRRHNMDFLNGAWAITSLNGTPMPAEGAEDAATMTINIPDLQIHGTTGCNIFNGQLFIDPDKNNSMQFVNIGTTRMACPPNSRETEFLLGLEMVETAKATGTDTIAMYSADGKLIFEMRRINYPREEQQVE